jgi:hypothetical protein
MFAHHNVSEKEHNKILEVEIMNEKQREFANVSLGGKRSKQKGEISADKQRYGQRDQAEGNKR